ncbi:DUF4215 domain-containing protein [Candidatus Peribacteria bacterium]|nr:DUF4215 domain-containing protein [Candidatus Peribacteria bacterium]
MTSFTKKYLSYRPLCVAFAMAALALLATVSFQRLPLEGLMARIRVRTEVMSSASATSMSPRDKLKMERLKREADNKTKAALQKKLSVPRQNSRYLRTSTAANVLGGTTDSASRSSIKYERSKCGDKLIISPETCDDGNASAGDGCSSSCKVENGYQCTTGQPSYCWDDGCGDGKIIASKEKCDDGNVDETDGCDSVCKIEPGYVCSGAPSVCTHP